ncbi:MAG: response regulator [Candidatus Solibacter sp.]|nr:response regulator [Candidatus Solibacter sp.]
MKILTPSPPKILLVDDNRDGLLVRRSLLEEIGCCVQIAVNGEEGLILFQAAKFDVIVTDYRMPGMNGGELIQRIRQLDPDARIILLSGFVEPLGLTEQNTGADAVITKSVNEPAHLVRWVKRLVNRAVRKPPGSQRTPKARATAIGQ